MSNWRRLHARARRSTQEKVLQRQHLEKEIASTRFASWENKTDEANRQRQLNAQVQHRQKQYELDLNRRRRLLAQKLELERLQYESELNSNIESDDVRRARLLEKAHALKSKREEKRLAKVAAIRESQFREGLDEFRTRRSKAITMYAAQDRKKQIQYKIQQKEEEERQNAVFHKEWIAQIDGKLARELEEKRIHAEKNSEVKEMLAYQLKEKEQIKLESKEEEDEFIARMKAEWQKAEQEEIAKQQRKVEENKKMNQLVKKHNDIKLEMERKEKEKENKLDMEILQRALAAEEEEKRKEHEAKMKAKEENLRFRKFIEEQMIKEKQDDSDLKAILKAENDKAWAQKEARWNREAEARRRLAEDVEQSRQTQLYHKAIRNERGREEDAMYIAGLKKKWADGEREDMQKKERILNEQRAYLRGLEHQRDSVYRRREEEKEQLARERRELAEADASFTRKMNKLFSSEYVPNTDHRRKKVEWYD